MIETEEDWRDALERIEQMMDDDDVDGEEFERLILEVEAYEAVRWPIDNDDGLF